LTADWRASQITSQRFWFVPNGHVWLPVDDVLLSSIALLAPFWLTVDLKAKLPPAVSVKPFSDPKRPRTKSLAFKVVTPVVSCGALGPPPEHFEFWSLDVPKPDA